MTFKTFIKQCIKACIDWLVAQWREAKTTANLNKEVRKYKEAAEELDPQPQPVFTEKGTFGEPGWCIELSHPAFTKDKDE